MVMPTPFDRLLQEAVQQAANDPVAAFARLDELYGKTLLDHDVLALGAFAVHLGGAVLGRWEETLAFQRRLLRHGAVAGDSIVARSLWRGLAVLAIGAGNRTEADKAAAIGATTPSERCRLAIMTAQALVARNRPQEAVPFLGTAALACVDLPADDEVVSHVAVIATNLGRAAEQQLKLAQDLLVQAARAATAAWRRHPDWRYAHKAFFFEGKAHLLAANPAAALGIVHDMMMLEDANDAEAAERFFTASLACRAQIIRGQFKVAAAALEACQDYARRVTASERSQFIQESLTEMERHFEVMKAPSE